MVAVCASYPRFLSWDAGRVGLNRKKAYFSTRPSYRIHPWLTNPESSL